jgi:glutathione S-transferase
MMAAVRLHRCPVPSLGPLERFHACARVQNALDDKGIEYEIVKEPLRPSKRAWIEEKTGQDRLPVVELPDGSTYREESKDMAARIEADRLFDGASGQTPA